MKWTDCATKADKWLWHAEIYAHRRVVLGLVADEKTAPCDPTGEWFNEDLIRAAAERLQTKRRKPEHFTFTDRELDDRREYAQLNGYDTWNHFLDAVHAGDQHIRPFIAWCDAKRQTTGPPTCGSFTKAGDALRYHSVTVTEKVA